MSSSITILVATMGGTAEMVAEEIASQLDAAGHRARITMMDEIAIGDIHAGVYIVCSSTYGIGEVPDNGKALFEAMRAEQPDLSGVLYGVVGLGDSIYPNTFCFGGKNFDDMFAALGAVRIGDRLNHDRRSPIFPEDAASEWAKKWVALLAERLSQPQLS